MSEREHDIDLIRDHIYDHGHTQDTDEQGCPYCAVNRIESALKAETQRADEAERALQLADAALAKEHDKAADMYDRMRKAEAKLTAAETESAATVCRLTAEIDDYADRLAAAERERDRYEWCANELMRHGSSYAKKRAGYADYWALIWNDVLDAYAAAHPEAGSVIQAGQDHRKYHRKCRPEPSACSGRCPRLRQVIRRGCGL